MKPVIENLNDNDLTTTFARSVYLDIQKYILEHLDEFEVWKKEQETSESR